MSMQIFVPGVGQFENIGDIILRRQLLTRMRSLGHLHIYVGASTDDYDSALGLTDDDHVYRSFRDWYFAALRATARGRGSYVFKPGEIQLTLLGMKEHVSMLPVAALARMNRRPVVRVGSGSRNFAKLPRALMRPSIALCNLVLWRDTRTARFLGGKTMPDLAFGEGSPTSSLVKARHRGLLVVSMRSDREETPQNWVDAVRDFARAHDLGIVAISQVIRDNPKTLELADRLGGEALPWDGNGHQDREVRLRDIYGRAEVVVSDRLHVLIAAFTEGALPAALLTDRSDKVARHFAAAGIEEIAMTISRETRPSTVEEWLTSIINRREPLIEALGVARAELDAVFDRVNELYASRSNSPKASGFAYQVGRSGEVPGGMTQVVNAYLDWDFEDFAPRLITSRGSYSRRAAAVVFARAIAAVLFAKRVRESVLVVHLSQGGSFVREGALLRLGRLRGFATVAQIHGSSFVEYASTNRSRVARVLRRAHGIHVLSEESAAVARRLAPDAVVRVIPNAVAEGAVRDKTHSVVFAGAIGRRKGVDVLLEAWSPEFAASGWTLKVAGPLTEQEVLPAQLPPAVELLGPLEHREVLALLEASRVAVLPSRDEAMPMFLIEAMARRNAVVSTTVGGIPALVDESVGILVPPGDSDALRSALATMLGNPDDSEKYQRGALDAFRRTFSAATVVPVINEFWVTARAKARGGG